MPKPWLQTPKESNEAYAAFLTFRDLGPTRDLEQVVLHLARKIYDDEPGPIAAHPKRIPPAYNTIKALSTRHKWADRALAWDNKVQEDRDLILRARARKWEMRKHEAADAIWEDAERMRRKGRILMDMPVLDSTITNDVDAEGRPITITIIKSLKVTTRDGRELMKNAAEMQAGVLHGMNQPIGEMTDAQIAGVLDEASGPRAIAEARSIITEREGGGPGVDADPGQPAGKGPGEQR